MSRRARVAAWYAESTMRTGPSRPIAGSGVIGDDESCGARDGAGRRSMYFKRSGSAGSEIGVGQTRLVSQHWVFGALEVSNPRSDALHPVSGKPSRVAVAVASIPAQLPLTPRTCGEPR
jgi:hypothetical protein